MEKDFGFDGSTSEIEILEFRAGGNSYGMNISDVKEILSLNNKSTPVPNAHPFIEGIIIPRDELITIVNFGKSLGLSEADEVKNDMLILTGINDLNIAFHVDSVSGIHRVATTQIEKPDEELITSKKDYIIGVLTLDERKIEIVELRKIILDINPEVKVG